MSLCCRRLSRQEYDAFCSTTESRGCDSQRWAQHCSTLGASAAEGLKLKEFEQLYLDSRFQKHHGLQVQDLRLSMRHPLPCEPEPQPEPEPEPEASEHDTAKWFADGQLLCQFTKDGGWIPVRVSFCRGSVLTMHDRHGTLVSTSYESESGLEKVGPPKTTRKEHPNALRVDLPEFDSTGCKKYVFDAGTADNLQRWTARLRDAKPSVAASLQPAQHQPEGVCKKQKPRAKLWPERYVQLLGQSLLVFNSREDRLNEPRAQRGSSIQDLRGYIVSTGKEPVGVKRSDWFSITCKHPKGGDSFTFCVESELLKDRFEDALRNVVVGRPWDADEEWQPEPEPEPESGLGMPPQMTAPKPSSSVRQRDLDIRAAEARAKPRWVPDDESGSCMLCEAEFGVLLRKHHCRYCGWLVCKDCQAKDPASISVDRFLQDKAPFYLITIPDDGTEEKKVCKSCAQNAPEEIVRRHAHGAPGAEEERALSLAKQGLEDRDRELEQSQQEQDREKMERQKSSQRHEQ